MKSISLKSKKVLGMRVTTSPKKEILEFLQKYLEQPSPKCLVVATPNPEQIVLAQREPRFAKTLNQAGVAIPDGIGLAWAAGVARIPGVEFMEELVRLAASRGYGIALIGGRGGVAVAALECLRRKYPGLRGWAQEPAGFLVGDLGYLGDLRERIRKTKTRLVFVGLGAPKQEELIAHLASKGLTLRGYGVVLMSVGGAFDMIAGRVPRAPAAIRAAGFEWLWRLVRQPRRFRRQLALVKFLWLVATRRS